MLTKKLELSRGKLLTTGELPTLTRDQRKNMNSSKKTEFNPGDVVRFKGNILSPDHPNVGPINRQLVVVEVDEDYVLCQWENEFTHDEKTFFMTKLSPHVIRHVGM